MKLSEFLKKLGINLDEDVDMTEKNTSDENNSINNLENVEKEKEVEKHEENEKTVEEVKDSNKNEEVKEVQKLKLNYDQKTGLFDLNGIEDEEVKAVLKLANNTVKNNANRAVIDKAVNDKLSTIKLNKGITSDVVLKMLNLDSVKVVDGAVTGLDEAFNNLKTTQSGLFMENKETNSNPLLEGFNPKNNAAQGNGTPSSFVEAFAMME